MSTRTVVPTYLTFPPTAPTDLEEVLFLQAARLIEIGAPHAAKIDAAKYCDELAAAIKDFSYSQELAAIGLTRVAIVDYRLSGKFLAEVGGIDCWTDPDKCRNFEGTITPEGILVIQAQWGTKFKGKAPRDCRNAFAESEQGGVPREGFTALIYESNALLKECNMDFPGSISECGVVPYLSLVDDRPGFLDRSAAYDNPGSGSVSRGRKALDA